MAGNSKEASQHAKEAGKLSAPVYAPFIDCVDRLRDAYVLIISGDATTEQMLALLLVIVLQTVYVVLLMRSVHRRATTRSDTQ